MLNEDSKGCLIGKRTHAGTRKMFSFIVQDLVVF